MEDNALVPPYCFLIESEARTHGWLDGGRRGSRHGEFVIKDRGVVVGGGEVVVVR